MLGVGVCIAVLFVVSISHWVYRWSNPKCKENLPPGSMGWPLLGETLHFLSTSQSLDIPFFKHRIKRYGSIFRTSLLGEQVIVSGDWEFNNMVLQQEGQAFENWQPKSLKRLFGSQNMSCLTGSLYKFLKSMVLTITGPRSIKKLFYELESIATTNMEGWASQETVNVKTAVADMIFEVLGKKLISYDPKKSSENLRENFDAFTKGIISFPLAIPGTPYYRCLQGRKKLKMMLKNMLVARKAKPNEVKNDLFDYVFEELQQSDTLLTEEISLDFIFGMWFAAFEPTSNAITLAIKLLTDNPRALKELTEEHEKIIGKRENPKTGLTWKEYKSMTFTFQVINETLRLANLSPVSFRKALTDFKFKDFTIPSGWVVMACHTAVHLDAANYKDPLNFNPGRWEGMDMKGLSKTNFMPFGSGLRACAGADYARLVIAVFLHCLVTKYRWQLIKGGDIVRSPFLKFPNGFHVKFFKKDNKQN